MVSVNAAVIEIGKHKLNTSVDDTQKEFLLSYFAFKSGKDAEGIMNFWSPKVETYTDAVLGWANYGFENLHAAFKAAMPQFGEGLSYPTFIAGNVKEGNGSFLIAFINTPEIVGNETRIVATVDIRDGKIVRWIDYWDSIDFNDDLYKKIRQSEDKFPDDYKEGVFGVNASPLIINTATGVQAAIAAADAAKAITFFDDDCVLEDTSLRVQIIGKAPIKRYFDRTLTELPLGKNSRLRHIVGGNAGGGFEWYGAPQTAVKNGVTALELNGEGKITRFTTVYDGRQLGEEKRKSLVYLSTQG